MGLMETRRPRRRGFLEVAKLKTTRSGRRSTKNRKPAVDRPPFVVSCPEKKRMMMMPRRLEEKTVVVTRKAGRRARNGVLSEGTASLSLVWTGRQPLGNLSNGRESLGEKPCDAHKRPTKTEGECTRVFRIENAKSGLFEKARIGSFEIDTWFASPYPEKLCSGADTVLFCEQCLQFFISETALRRHKSKCIHQTPPGRVVYHDPKQNIGVYEVDGAKSRIFCQNICLFCKLFLDAKSMSYEVGTFYFYIMTVDGEIVGYFSKEKQTRLNYNLACILIFPQYQHEGYGKFLISLSYQLSKAQGKIGNPEKPLSEFGLLAYRSFWKFVIMDFFFGGPLDRLDSLTKRNFNTSKAKDVIVDELKKSWALKPEDTVDTLHHFGMVKGDKILIKKRYVEEYMNNREKVRICHPSLLRL